MPAGCQAGCRLHGNDYEYKGPVNGPKEQMPGKFPRARKRHGGEGMFLALNIFGWLQRVGSIRKIKLKLNGEAL